MYINTVSPAGLEVFPLGPKWGRWAKKLRCASDPPIPADCRLEDRMHTKSSFFKGMTEFQEGEVSVICRKIILIHGQGPGFCYFEDNRFK